MSSSSLKNIFWYDKDDESARNNRNVYINKLRIVLKAVGDVKIVNNKGYWLTAFGDDIFCDYRSVLSLIAALDKSPDLDKSTLNRLLDIAGKGKLLPFCEAEWLDDIKSDYADLLIDFLLKKSALVELKDDLPLLLKISDVILIQDNIDESGIRLKCNTLFRMDKKKSALLSFNKFAQEHVKLLGVETKLTLKSITAAP